MSANLITANPTNMSVRHKYSQKFALFIFAINSQRPKKSPCLSFLVLVCYYIVNLQGILLIFWS